MIVGPIYGISARLNTDSEYGGRGSCEIINKQAIITMCEKQLDDQTEKPS